MLRRIHYVILAKTRVRCGTSHLSRKIPWEQATRFAAGPNSGKCSTVWETNTILKHLTTGNALCLYTLVLQCMFLLHFTSGRRRVRDEHISFQTLQWILIFIDAHVAAVLFVHGAVMFLGIPPLSAPALGAVDLVMENSSTCYLRTRKQEVLIVRSFKCFFFLMKPVFVV